MSAKLLIAPVIGVPVTGLLWYNSHQKNPEDRVGSSFLLTTWIASGFIGPTSAGAAQFVIAWPAGKVVFGDGLDRYIMEFGRSENEVKLLPPETVAFRRDLAYSTPNLLAIVFMSTLAPLTEEVFKFAALKTVERYFPTKTKTKRNYVLIAMAVGLGFALVENLAFIAAATDKSTQTQLAITIIERSLFGTSGHLLTAALTGCKFAQMQGTTSASKSMWSTIKESMLYHGLGNFGLFVTTTLYGNVGFVHPPDALGMAAMFTYIIGVNACAAWRVSSELKRIDSESVRKTS